MQGNLSFSSSHAKHQICEIKAKAMTDKHKKFDTFSIRPNSFFCDPSIIERKKININEYSYLPIESNSVDLLQELAQKQAQASNDRMVFLQSLIFILELSAQKDAAAITVWELLNAEKDAGGINDLVCREVIKAVHIQARCDHVESPSYGYVVSSLNAALYMLQTTNPAIRR